MFGDMEEIDVNLRENLDVCKCLLYLYNLLLCNLFGGGLWYGCIYMLLVCVCVVNVLNCFCVMGSVYLLCIFVLIYVYVLCV